MRFIFKTTYNQDIDLAKHGGHVFWYAMLLLALVIVPPTVKVFSELLSQV